MTGEVWSYVKDLPYGALGFGVGVLYFRALARGVRVFLGGGPKGRALVWHGGRIAGGVAVFWAVSTQGAVPLLLTFAGFLAARLVVARPDGEGRLP